MTRLICHCILKYVRIGAFEVGFGSGVSVVLNVFRCNRRVLYVAECVERLSVLQAFLGKVRVFLRKVQVFLPKKYVFSEREWSE